MEFDITKMLVFPLTAASFKFLSDTLDKIRNHIRHKTKAEQPAWTPAGMNRCLSFWLAVLALLRVKTAPGAGLPYKSDGNARRKIKIKPLRETNVGAIQD